MSNLRGKPATNPTLGPSAKSVHPPSDAAKTQHPMRHRYDGQMASKLGRVRNTSFVSPEQINAERNARRRERHWAKTKTVQQGNQGTSADIIEDVNAKSQAPLSGSNNEEASIEKLMSLFDEAARQATEGDDWATPLRIPPRDEVIARLVQNLEDDILQLQNAQQNAIEVAETVTGSMAFHYKRIVEQFEDNACAVNLDELTAYLDHREVPIDGRDRHIYARVARLAKTRLNSSLRNKIANIVAGACLLGIRSDDLHERCKQGFEIGPKKKISTGPSALGRYYKEYEAAQSAAVSLRDGQITGNSEDAQSGTGESEIVDWPEAVRVLSDALSSEQVSAHFQSGGGRMIKIGRIVHGKNGIVFEAA